MLVVEIGGLKGGWEVGEGIREFELGIMGEEIRCKFEVRPKRNESRALRWREKRYWRYGKEKLRV